MFKRSHSSEVISSALSSLYRFEDFDMKLMNSGGYADVFKAIHLKSGHVMVIKKPKRRVCQPIMTRESELMIKLNHQNLLKAYGVIIEDGVLSLVMEFINGGSLQSFVTDEDNILPWTTRIRLGVDVANGMGYMHRMGYLHRDLTSLNVLVRTEGSVIKAVICDFGLASRVPQRGKVLCSVGTPFCRSPESIRGEYYDQKADVFSFGIIMCELILRCDYDPDNLPRTQNYGVDYRKIGEMVEDCPVSFLALAFLCCHMDPKKRPLFPDISFLLDSTLVRCMAYGCSEATLPSNIPRRCNSFDDVSSAPTDMVDDIISTSDGILSPREVGEIMTQIDPHYTSDRLDPINLLHLTSRLGEKDSPKATPSQESVTTCSSTSSIQRFHINSLPLTNTDLQVLGDRCLYVLPSDKNLKKRTEYKPSLHKKLFHMPAHHLSVLNSFDRTDSGISSMREKMLRFKNKSLNNNFYSGQSEDDIMRHFFKTSASSFNSSSEIADDENDLSNVKFYRFMRQYLVACLRSQYPVKSSGRGVYLPPECLKRMKEARELFKSKDK